MGFKDQEKHKAQAKVAKEQGLSKVKLSKTIRDKMTPQQKRVGNPQSIGLSDHQKAKPLEEAWCHSMLSAGKGVQAMAEEGGVTETEMRRILQEYGFIGSDVEGATGPWPWDYERTGFRSRG